MPRKEPRSTPQPFTLFHLQDVHAGETLSAVLKVLLPKSTWTQVNQWIARRHIQVNGNLCLDPARRVTEKDVIKLWQEALPKPVGAEYLRLPYIDEHILVVEKPAAITSVWHREERKLPTRRRELQPTLEELLPAAIAKAIGPPRDPRSGGRGRPGPRPAQRPRSGSSALRWPVFPVHRLDRDTSGLMLFARTRLAEQKLVAMFRDHRVERQYWGLAIGHVASQTIRSVLVRDRGDGLRGSLAGTTTLTATSPPALPRDNLATDATGASNGPSSAASSSAAENMAGKSAGRVPTESEAAAIAKSQGQLAITHVECIETIGEYSLLRCRLETGRTHQIRIHLSELGYPLCGEKTYTRSVDGHAFEDVSEAPRQALHAERLAFVHPLTGERLEFRMPLPLHLKRWLDGLKSAAGRREGQVRED